MIDKLTKKRLKVDYVSIIRLAGLQDAFVSYLCKKDSKISLNRKAQAFCRSKKLDVSYYYSMIIDKNITNADELLQEEIRIAHVKWLDED